MSTPSLWQPHRRDFLKASSLVLFGLTTGCTLTPTGTNPKRPLKFAMFTDMHYADRDTTGTATRYYRQSLAKSHEAVTQLRTHNPEFLAILGDMKDMNEGEPDAKTLSWLTTIEAEIQKFGGPTYHVLGNHDMDNLSKKQVLSAITNTGITTGKPYYAFSRGGIRFIALDACCLKDGKDYDHGNFESKECYVPTPQLDFLSTELKAAKEPVILLVHQRLDGTSDVCIRNAADVRAILESSGKVLAAFHGHDHAGAHYLINGIHYYTLIAVVEGTGEANNSYALVEVQPDLTLAITGFRRAVSMQMPKSA